MSDLAWIVASGLAMSVIALVGSLTLIMPMSLLRSLLLPLVAFATGALLGGALFHMLPSAIDALGDRPRHLREGRPEGRGVDAARANAQRIGHRDEGLRAGQRREPENGGSECPRERDGAASRAERRAGLRIGHPILLRATAYHGSRRGTSGVCAGSGTPLPAAKR